MHESNIPILSLWGRLVVPLQGDISDSQMDRLQEALLRKIRATAPVGVVLDTTGIWMMDSHLCAELSRLAEAARLMGTRPIVCGLSPAIVMTLQAMGVELRSLEITVGLEDALERLGVWPDDAVEEDALAVELATHAHGTNLEERDGSSGRERT